MQRMSTVCTCMSVCYFFTLTFRSTIKIRFYMFSQSKYNTMPMPMFVCMYVTKKWSLFLFCDLGEHDCPEKFGVVHLSQQCPISKLAGMIKVMVMMMIRRIRRITVPSPSWHKCGSLNLSLRLAFYGTPPYYVGLHSFRWRSPEVLVHLDIKFNSVKSYDSVHDEVLSLANMAIAGAGA